MQNTIKKLLRHNEVYIFLVILLLSFVIQFQSGQFYTVNNIVDLVAALIVPGLFAIGSFMVLLSGGIDVSFPALAALSVYATTRLLGIVDFQGNIFLPILLCIVIGAVLGAVNGFLISRFNLQPLIVTLGVASIFKGVMQGVLKSVQIATLPKGMTSFGTSSLFIVKNADSGLTSRMPVSVIILIIVLFIAYFILNHTLYGRGIYAIGGNEVSAERAGFDVMRIKLTLYILVGVISSLAGLIRTCMMTQMHPTNMLGMEMMIIAGVVLGGVAITGGAGTLTGCMLGTTLIVLVQNSLILIGVPTFWQRFFLGTLIIVGTAISAGQIFQGSKTKKIKLRRRVDEIK